LVGGSLAFHGLGARTKRWRICKTKPIQAGVRRELTDGFAKQSQCEAEVFGAGSRPLLPRLSELQLFMLFSLRVRSMRVRTPETEPFRKPFLATMLPDETDEEPVTLCGLRHDISAFCIGLPAVSLAGPGPDPALRDVIFRTIVGSVCDDSAFAERILSREGRRGVHRERNGGRSWDSCHQANRVYGVSCHNYQTPFSREG